MSRSRPSALVRRGLKVAWSLLLLGGGGFLLLSLATAEEWRAAWAAGLGVGAPVLVLLALPAVSHFIKMLGWRALLPREHRPPLSRAYAAFVAAQGVNELGFSVLGEPLKVMVLSAEGRAAGVKAVVTDNLAALAALFAVIATLAQLGVAALPVLALSLIILRRMQSERLSGVLTAFLAHYLGKMWLLVELGLGLHFLGQPSLVATGQLALACLGAAAVGAPVPGQLGVVEAALLHAGGMLGIATSSLVTLALIRRLRSLLWIAIGFALAIRITRHKTGEEQHVSTALA
ncbi:MAG TPA: hypothetical protein VEX18_12670 [Polyangiaceae bacterium]|nr:hypothetical protein [Polyangiaceae bacterium]